MSGTQSTLTDRTPDILNKDPTDKKPKNDKSSVSLKHEFDPTGLVQRCVIIQRDENGFGLTVSGDNPVFVQLVKEDGAAMRAGVQTGDRIIKVNGTLVTHSNHIEVVKLIKSGSYVALTVLGRPPGLPQIPLEEDEEAAEEGAKVKLLSSPSVPQVPALTCREQCSLQGNTSPQPAEDERKLVHSQKVDSLKKMLTKQDQELQWKEEEYGRHPQPKLLKEIQESKNHISQLQEQLSKAVAAVQDGAAVSRKAEGKDVDGVGPVIQASSSQGDASNDGPLCNNNTMHSSPVLELGGKREPPCQSPSVTRRDGLRFHTSPDTEDSTGNDLSAHCIVGSPPYHPNNDIIGSEDDDFGYQQEQINGECSCFQSIDVLKSRPAHLAVFLHHVVSQFDPAPLLCYLYADMHKQTSSKESRREFHSLFIDRAANLKVQVPETISAELEKRRLELIPEELCKQYTQMLQDSLLPDLNRNLEDFRQKRSMGLTLAEDELCKMDTERGKDQQALEKECSCAEHILSKIEDILLTSQPSEEEKCQMMQCVIVTYMKHLGVKVKEPRGPEHKRLRRTFLPKIKKTIKSEKESEEKVKKPRFPNILVPPRRLSRVDSTSVGKAVEQNKQRSPKQLPQSGSGGAAEPDSPASSSGRMRGAQLSDGSDTSALTSTSSPAQSSPVGLASDTSGQDSDSNVSPFSLQPKLGEGLLPGDHQDSVFTPTSTQFDFSHCSLEQLQEEDPESYRLDMQCGMSAADFHSEDDQGAEVECEEDPLNWQSVVSRGILASLTPQEIKRQEVINELFYTERAHLRMLKVLDVVFNQRLNRDGILPPEDVRHIFVNLEEIIQLHVFLTEQMTAIRKRKETSVIGQIGDDLLSWFSEEEEEKIKIRVGTFCSNQPSALELIKTRQKKDQRFNLFLQEAESNRLCRRLQLKDIIPVEMQRVTKYPLLLDNIAKFTEDAEERKKVTKAGECCKKILNHVNQAVKEAENKQRLEDYQRRLDLSSLKQSENPMILELKNLDLTKSKMIHEGPLTWKIKEKTIELHTILLEDILVLLQKQDERLVLRFHGKSPVSATDTKNIFSPIIKLNTVLVRPVATDNKSFFVLSTSENGPQIYELTAQTVSDQRMWQCLITQSAEAKKAKPHSRAAQSDSEQEAIEIINCGMTGTTKEPSEASNGVVNSTGKDAPPSPDIQHAPSSISSFDGMKSEDEEEEPTEAELEDEEVDEAELEAFLDGQLAERHPFLQQEGSRRGIAIDSQEHNAFSVPSSKAEDALRILAMLKQVLFNHMMKREAEEDGDEAGGRSVTESLGGRSPAGDESQASAGSPLSGDTGPSDSSQRNGGFVVLDFPVGSEDGGADDDGGEGCDLGIDMRKLLSSSSQPGGGGPNLSRQLMTHLRLLQADLQYLKEVEMKYNELRQTHTDMATNSDDNNDAA